jgi:hypothetical protein
MSNELFKSFSVLVVMGLLTFIAGFITISVLFHDLASTNIKNEYLTKQVQNLLHQCDCSEGGTP